MKKTVIKRATLGFPLGVFLGYTITIAISPLFAKGVYSPVAPALVQQVGSQWGAVVLQYFLCGLLGAVCAAASCVWEMESWGLTKQTIVHFLLLAGGMFPISYFAGWMNRTVGGILLYIAIFLIIYLVLWLVLTFYWKNRVRQMNAGLAQK